MPKNCCPFYNPKLSLRGTLLWKGDEAIPEIATSFSGRTRNDETGIAKTQNIFMLLRGGKEN
jgi:hypothetical protein